MLHNNQESGQTMTVTREVPLQMRRNGFDPVEELAQARDGEGVVRMMAPFGVPAYLVLPYEDVREVLSDPTRFSSAFRTGGTPGGDPGERGGAQAIRTGNLIGLDPPEHTRLRRMLTPEFTVRRMHRLQPRITHRDRGCGAGRHGTSR
jgi:cytochrome P450